MKTRKWNKVGADFTNRGVEAAGKSEREGGACGDLGDDTVHVAQSRLEVALALAANTRQALVLYEVGKGVFFDHVMEP